MMPNALRALRSLLPPEPAIGEDGEPVDAGQTEPISAEAFLVAHGAQVLEALELGGLVERDELGCLHLTAAGLNRLA